ncbi:UDP-glucuronosyltransferase 2B31 [Camelus dromedarius]|uniref:glucuronosyltransferase n=1 Tax=Camelus dromedarius TaxID=9838 RepID=A0A5N4EI78_CAMDR|nr:UDP-glucuronosyltransferase 2B31 [Camelus dromedarius]
MSNSKRIEKFSKVLHVNKMSMKWLSLLLLLQLNCYFSSGSCGKVLVWPVEYSHWINMNTILDELITRGHEVTVLISSASIFINPNTQSSIKFEIFPTLLTKDNFKYIFKHLLEKWINFAKDSFWTYFSTVQSTFLEFSDILITGCKDLVSNKKLMTKLHESRFDVVLADAIGPCGELLAEILQIPLVYSLRFSPGFLLEKYGGKLPLPPSYVPVIMSELGDQMTFMERVKNMMYVLYFDFWFQTFNEKKWNQFYSEVLGRPTTLFETIGKADMWLIRTFWDFEFPHPLLPNFEFVGGLHCRPAKPLPMEMEEFVQSSGEDGIVVFTLGSMSLTNRRKSQYDCISPCPDSTKEKVLWRYHGKKPDTLGPNTRLYKWIPQNDLLGHPKTKAFITHGGTNGIYEAIYHGIPMLKQNAMRLSTIPRSTYKAPGPSSLLDRVCHAPQRSQAPCGQPLTTFTWCQYHSLDVTGSWLVCVAVLSLSHKMLSVLLQEISYTRKRRKKGVAYYLRPDSRTPHTWICFS